MKNLLTKEAFADWCEKQPAHSAYNLYDTNHCAVAQFAKSLGFVSSWPDFSIDAGGGRSLKIDGLTEQLMCRGGNTFGALAQRLRSKSDA